MRRVAPPLRSSPTNYGISADVPDETPLPPCHGLGWLFDSREIGDHLIAREYCKDCPFKAGCAAEFETCRQEARGFGSHAGPEGTWAGVLYNARSQPLDVRVGTCKGCDKPMLPGGTSSLPPGYVIHQHHGRCAACDMRKRRAEA